MNAVKTWLLENWELWGPLLLVVLLSVCAWLCARVGHWYGWLGTIVFGALAAFIALLLVLGLGLLSSVGR